jgi:flavin reductase (DIM6/NTAB) family NADH-FMN oxidoreductase RutF
MLDHVDPTLFREVLARFPAGVVVVTAMTEHGTPSGLTVSAFCSVSAEPPLVLVCIDKQSQTLPAIRHSGSFAVNILAAGREDLALRFASKRPDKFDAVAWEPTERGAPILPLDTSAHLTCSVVEAVEAGDHWVFIGRVEDAGHADDHVTLVYHRRAFGAVG